MGERRGDLFRGRPYKEDSQLAGALIVDPPGAVVDDRVFVTGLWQTTAEDDAAHNVAVINGKSWPYTEPKHFARTGDAIDQRKRFRVFC